MPARQGISNKHRRFIDEYIICLNATEACRRAGFEGESAVLAVTGSRLLRNANVLAEIDRRLNSSAMSANEVLSHLTDIARGDLDDVLNAAGGIDPAEARRRGKSHLIKKYKVRSITTDDQEIIEGEVEMYSRLEALNLLAKYHDLVNRVRIEDWRSEVVAHLKAGTISKETVMTDLGSGLAEELFVAAGIPVLTDGEG